MRLFDRKLRFNDLDINDTFICVPTHPFAWASIVFKKVNTHQAEQLFFTNGNIIEVKPKQKIIRVYLGLWGKD